MEGLTVFKLSSNNLSVSQLVIPWCTFTHPEIAHVGPYEQDMDEKGIKYDFFQLDFEENDRAICDGATEGFVKIYVKKGTDSVNIIV